MKTENFLMRFFRKLGFDSVAWSLRRLYCPVKKEDLVLEIGSGANPYFRANILCDAYLETAERSFIPLVYDRPTILAFAENLPFRDNAFDFVIACHVLEHSSEPEKFFEEIQRVGKAGYIETPDAFMERVCSYPIHRLEITDDEKMLIIRKKKEITQDQELRKLFVHKASPVFPDWVSRHPFHFHIRYYWSRDNGGIKYKIVNPKYKFDWDPPVAEITPPRTPHIASIKQFTLFIIRKLFSQNKRNRQINLLNLLICNRCKNDNLEKNQKSIVCKKCFHQYPIMQNGIIDFTK